MADVELSTITPLTQKAYDGDPVSVLFKPEGTSFRNRCGLESNGMGDSFNFEIISEGTTLTSPDYSLAGGAMTAYRFAVTPMTYHFRATVTREAIDAAKLKGSKALFQTQKLQLDMAIEVAMKKIDRHLAAVNGEIGTITGVTGSQFTLVDKSAFNRLRKGMTLVSAATNGSGALSGVEEIVSTINPDTGVVTTVSACGFTNGDTIWEKGDVFTGQTKKKSLSGAFAWCGTTAAAGSENFYGLDRSTDPDALQPGRSDYAGVPLRKALIRAAGRNAAVGRPVKVCYVAEPQYTSLREEADDREIVNITMEKSVQGGKKITIGLEAIRLTNGHGGTMDVLMWPYCPAGVFLMGDDDKGEFKLVYTDKLVRLHLDEGALWHRLEDGITSGGESVPALRAEGSLRLNLICKSPAHWFVGTSFTGA
jgi:hypothetical protein